MSEENLDDFLRGFAEATGLSIEQADEQWAGFSRGLSEADRKSIEAGGYDFGVLEGRTFRALYPVPPQNRRTP